MTKSINDNCYRRKGEEWIRCTREWAQREEPLWIEFSCDAQHLWTAYVMGRGFMSKTFATLEGYRSLSLAKKKRRSNSPILAIKNNDETKKLHQEIARTRSPAWRRLAMYPNYGY